MTAPISPQERDPRDHAESDPTEEQSDRRLRLVGNEARSGDRIETKAGSVLGVGRWKDVSRKLLLPADEWRRRWPNAPEGWLLARAHLPHISSHARIRSDLEAGRALGSVIEMLATGGGLELPCGDLGDAVFGLVVPDAIELEYIAEAIDEALHGQVRATDLQGPLRDRSRARVELL